MGTIEWEWNRDNGIYRGVREHREGELYKGKRTERRGTVQGEGNRNKGNYRVGREQREREL
ncbi:hypothetical protein DPMN_180632 [Dreissena polymorpha]|uniref:Uncharacterized protein n=1 Tax=Dreissena polymorpha TaxID=45954 RepID=A0A9D4EGB5_DREPO|nr:hypothetical protein DPMN_180632 [Dreissena polymorpha]